MASTLSYPNSLHSHLQYRHFLLQLYRHNQKRNLRIHNFSRPCSGQLKIVGRNGTLSFRCLCKTKTEIEKVPAENNQLEEERPPFDINLAVILAGFAFEAYTSSPENVRSCEIDASGCKTIYLSESFVREIYDGQLFIKLKRGIDLPAMDPWGTSDPYVVMQLDGQVVKSKTKWGKKEPTWNEDFNFNVKLSPTKNIQVAAWDANLVTPHKRMGNTSISLELLCDGDMHGVLVELEGMGGGGKLEFEEQISAKSGKFTGRRCRRQFTKRSPLRRVVKYKSFEEIDEENKWWEIPFISELLRKNGFDSALKMFAGTESIPARQFVEYAFGQLKSFNDAYLRKDQLLNGIKGGAEGVEVSNDPNVAKNISLKMTQISGNRSDDSNFSDKFLEEFHLDNAQSNKQFWKNFADTMNQNVVQKLGISVPEKLKWDGLDMLNNIGLQAQKIAESGYIESGLATSEGQESDTGKSSASLSVNTVQSSLPDIRKVKQDLLRQTESVLGALMVLTAAVSQLNKGIKNEATEDSSTKMESTISKYIGNQNLPSSVDSSELEEKVTEEMKALFSSAESAMEAWAMLATSLGHPSFIKSEFEKICFLDNETTDTQVALWRDLTRKRLVVAFRGTEQAKWKDLLTDLMMAPAGLNPERIGGDFKQEIQVHSGFLSAYDSVHIRIISLIKQAIGYVDEIAEPVDKWQIYVTGHSLGGALATLLALELSSSQLAKRQLISVTMYNFGSPRVGNRRFADVYNEKVKDSWRVVNHRDIIPTVPRLMGYCHVAQPIYLAGGGLRDALETLEVWKDGYQGDVIGEYTPDVLVGEVMKGEKELIEKILQTEINIFRAIRDGSALMQHMEDFYYISLLESVRSNYQTGARSETGDDDTISIS